MSRRGTWAIIALAPIVLLYASLLVGRFPVHPGEVLRILIGQVAPIERSWSTVVETIVMRIRLPRACMALAIGAGLAVSGAAFQGMFRNPLVSTDILGVSAASGFGAALALLLSLDAFAVQLVAFVTGLAGVTIAYLLARQNRTTPLVMLVLAGVVVAAFFSALVSAVKYTADPESKLPAITYWLLGSLNDASQRTLVTVLPSIAAGSIGLLAVRWRLNLLAMGDDEARALGVRTERLKGFIVACATLVTAAAVSACGIVGWVGLVIPHVARMVVGPDHRVLLPASMCIGGAYLLAIDDVARTITAGEIPLGILTAVIGAPFFAWLLRATGSRWR